MTRTGSPPRINVGRLLSRWAEVACGYIANILLAVVVLVAHAV